MPDVGDDAQSYSLSVLGGRYDHIHADGMSVTIGERKEWSQCTEVKNGNRS
jgi:hypothetical protein